MNELVRACIILITVCNIGGCKQQNAIETPKEPPYRIRLKMDYPIVYRYCDVVISGVMEEDKTLPVGMVRLDPSLDKDKIWHLVSLLHNIPLTLVKEENEKIAMHSLLAKENEVPDTVTPARSLLTQECRDGYKIAVYSNGNVIMQEGEGHVYVGNNSDANIFLMLSLMRE